MTSACVQTLYVMDILALEEKDFCVCAVSVRMNSACVQTLCVMDVLALHDDALSQVHGKPSA